MARHPDADRRRELRRRLDSASTTSSTSPRAPIPIPVDVVVVVGGGNTAIDCARTALRTGAERVMLVYRRTRDEMPAEAVRGRGGARPRASRCSSSPRPRRSARPDGLSAALPADGARRAGPLRPSPSGPGRGQRLRASTPTLIIGAIGQSTDTRFLYNDLPVRLNKWGDVDIDGSTMQASESKIFAGGDCVTGPATVIQAVAAGRRAAWAIDQFVTRGYVRGEPEDYTCSRGSLEDLPRDEFEDAAEARPRADAHPPGRRAGHRLRRGRDRATPRRRHGPRRPAACAAAARHGSSARCARRRPSSW